MPSRPARALTLPTVPISWRLPISVALLAVTAASLVMNAIIATPGSGPAPIDYTTFAPAGREILTGNWVGVFEDPIIQAGPFELIFWGIPFLLGVQGVTGWIAFGIIVGSLFVVAIAWLVERLLRPVTAWWSVPLALVVATVAALSGMIAAAISAGHPAEIAIPLMWIVGAVLARRGAPFAAAAVLAATAGWELWGLLGVPVLLLAPRIDPRTVWRSALAGIGVLAILFGPFVLLGPFHMFSFAWPIRTNSLAHLLVPHEATFPWPLRLTQGVLAVGGGAVVAVLLRRQRDAIWLVPLVVCAVRLYTDPVLAMYYGVPPLMMVLIGAVFAIARRSAIVFVACLLMVNALIDVPLNVVSMSILVILVAVTTVVTVRRSRRGEVDSSFSSRPITA